MDNLSAMITNQQNNQSTLGYEILSFKSSPESVIWELKEGSYFSMYLPNSGQSLVFMLMAMKIGVAGINSVKRLSDGVVITLKDEVEGYGKILMITLGDPHEVTLISEGAWVLDLYSVVKN